MSKNVLAMLAAKQNASPKCHVCAKTVYKPEELLALGRVYHVTCFCCGSGGGEDGEKGCKRTMKRDGYVDRAGEPFCTSCYDKNFKPKGFIGGGGNFVSSYRNDAPPATAAEAPAPAPAPVAAPSPPPVSAPSPTLSPTPAPAPVYAPMPAPVSVTEPTASTGGVAAMSTVFSKLSTTSAPAPSPSSSSSSSAAYKPKVVVNTTGAPKCCLCAKTVYKPEEVQALGRIWHQSCFTCGGGKPDTLGCKKTLKKMEGYVDHDNQPFCSNCHSKFYKPKGYGFSNTLDSYANANTNPASTAPAVTASSKNATIDTSSAVTGLTPNPGVVVTASTPAAAAEEDASGGKAYNLPSVTTQKATNDLYKESGYVGNHDEVHEDEW